MQSPRIGLALAGGAARGLFHVGVIRALSEAGIQVDAWAGTSAGAVVSAACAAGLAPAQVTALATKIRWTENIVGLRQSALDWMGLVRVLWGGSGPKKPGFVETSQIGSYINEVIGHRRFSELPPLILTATDIHSGEEVLFCSPEVAARLEAAKALPRIEGEAWRDRYVPRQLVVAHDDVGQAVRCSACIPTVMSSVTVECGGRTRMLNDGGIVDMVPVKPLRALGCRKVIAVFLGFLPQAENVRHLVDVGVNAAQFLARDQICASLEAADLVLYDPAIESRSFVFLDSDLIEQGYRYTLAQLPRILAAIREDVEPAAERVPATVLAGETGETGGVFPIDRV